MREGGDCNTQEATMIFKSPYADVEIPNIPLTRFILERIQAYGDHPALIDGPTGRTLTYRQLAGAIRLVASSLSKRGFGTGDVFAIFSPNLPEYAVAFHAVTLLGGIVTTLNPLYTADEVAHQLNDAGATYLLTISAFLEKARAAAANSKVKEIFTFDPVEGATLFATLLQSDGALPDAAFDPAAQLAV